MSFNFEHLMAVQGQKQAKLKKIKKKKKQAKVKAIKAKKAAAFKRFKARGNYARNNKWGRGYRTSKPNGYTTYARNVNQAIRSKNPGFFKKMIGRYGKGYGQAYRTRTSGYRKKSFYSTKSVRSY